MLTPSEVHHLIAQNLFTARKEKGWTQNRLAEEAGVTESSIHVMENRKSLPRLINFRKICKALGVDTNKILLMDDD